MGGILLIRNLVDVVYTEHDLHLQKLGRYLQKVVDYRTDIKDVIPEVIIFISLFKSSFIDSQCTY